MVVSNVLFYVLYLSVSVFFFSLTDMCRMSVRIFLDVCVLYLSVYVCIW